MSDEHDSWFKDVLGVDLGRAAQRIQDEARNAASQVVNTVTQAVQDARTAVGEVIDDPVGAVTGVAKKVAAAAGGGGAGGGGLRAGGPGTLAGGGTGKFPLSGSVGRGGQNAPNDVKAVQRALGISDDGKCGAGTITAIESFQRSIGQSKPDGRVDAGGQTERALASGAKASPSAASGEADSGSLFDKAIKGAKDLAGGLAGGAAGGLADGGLHGELPDGMLGGLVGGVSSLADKVQKGLASIDPKSLRMDSGGAFSGGSSSSASPKKTTSGANSSEFQQGYKDGLDGAEPNPGPRIGDALDEYQDGYLKGSYERDQKLFKEELEKRQREREELDEQVFKVIEHVIFDGLVHGVTHILKLGGGVFALIVSTVGGMKCDTKLYRFKCATCGEQENECTEEDARADAEKHKKEHPDHVVDTSGPGID